MTRGGKSYYYLTDALGSTVAMVDEAGKKTASYYYSPRGVTVPTETKGAEQPYRFAGTYQDATAMYHMGARYYDPRIGRFTQPDPSGQETNPYLYAAGDPVNQIDPTGLGFLDGLKRVAKSSMEWTVGGAITGCITTLAEGCIAGASVGAVGGAFAGLGVGAYKETQ